MKVCDVFLAITDRYLGDGRDDGPGVLVRVVLFRDVPRRQFQDQHLTDEANSRINLYLPPFLHLLTLRLAPYLASQGHEQSSKFLE